MKLRLACIAASLITACASTAASQTALPEPIAAIDNPHASMATLLRCLADHTTLASGHRGGIEPGFPENAVETFANTLRQAPMLLEVDVRTTSDGVLVLMHDETLERTTNGAGRVADISWPEMSALHLRDQAGAQTAFHPTSLDRALAWSERRALLLLDMKPNTSEEAVVDAIRRHNAQERAGVIVYSLDQAVRFHTLDPNVTIFFPVARDSDIDALQARGVALDNIVAWAGIGIAQPHLWASLRARGLPVAFGALFYIDPILEDLDDYRYFNIMAERGLSIVATDLHKEAFATLNESEPVADALRLCGAMAR